MPQVIAGLNQYSNEISAAPSAGDPAASAVVRACLQVLLNNTVNLKSNEGHKIDDRGGTFTLTDTLTINGSETFAIGTEVFTIGNAPPGADTTLSVQSASVVFQPNAPFPYQTVQFLSEAVWLSSPQVTIGTGASHALTVNAETEFQQDVTFTNDVTIGNGTSDTLEVNGPANFNSNVDVDGTLTVDSTLRANGSTLLVGNTDIQGALNASGSVTLGNASSDAVAINGTITAQAEATFQGPVTVNDSVDLGSSGSHTVTVNAQLVTERDTTIGNSSSDDLTINATLVTALTMSGLGQVAFKTGTLTAGTDIGPDSGSTVFLLDQGPGSNVYVIESGWATGAWFAIAANDSLSTIGAVVQRPAGGTSAVGWNTNRFVLFVHTGNGHWLAIEFGPTGTTTEYS